MGGDIDDCTVNGGSAARGRTAVRMTLEVDKRVDVPLFIVLVLSRLLIVFLKYCERAASAAGRALNGLK